MPDGHGQADSGGITVKSVGLQWYHPGGFRVDRPQGLPDYTFVQWLTPALLRLGGAGGAETRECAGGCIVYRPGDPHWYGSDVFTPFGNNWFHFNGPGTAALLEECDIPVNRPLRLRNDSLIEKFLRIFLRETMSTQFGRQACLSAHAMLFFVEFGRMLRWETARSQSARNMEWREKFETFRESLRERCTEAWTLTRMAGELHLSASRFSNLYREFFASGPVDDLIRMRIDLAEYYLRTTVMPVNYVADLCGFTDIYYFSRTFKAKTGQTATAYRNAARAE